MKTRFEWLLILAAASGALLAETPSAKLDASAARLQVPVLGFVTGSAPISLRPILGAPGSVVLGDAIPLPGQLTKIAVAPGQQYAIVELDGGTEAAILPLDSGVAGDLQTIPGTVAHWDRIAFSNSGSFAVLYSAAEQRLQVVSGLPSQAAAMRTLDPAGLGNVPVSALAVSDDGQSVLIGQSDGTSGSVSLFAADQPANRIAAAGDPSALKFLPDSQDALLADRGLKQVLIITGGQPRLIAGEAQGVTSPADVEISADRQRVWIADANGLMVVQIDSGTVATESCPYPPASLSRLAAKSVFLITAQDGESSGLWAPETPNRQVWRLPGGHKAE